jgi:hypothetical protein
MSNSAALAPYLQKEYPKFSQNEGSEGRTYLYRYPNTGGRSKPAIGDLWADGLPLTSIEETPSLDNSGYNELNVSTVYSVSGGGPETTTVEEVRYQIRWNPTQLPLIRHSYFQPGKTGDLFTAIGGKKPIEDVIGWEYEQNPNLKADRKYQKLNSDGTPSGTITTISTAQVIAFIKLRQLGFDSYTEFTPTWQKVSIYRGQDAPGVGAIGQYVAGSSVPELPSDLETFDYIKSGDSAERIGTQSRWQRTEEWTGFTRVYFDTDSMNPASHTIP